jgi:YegS/Rv2252/BmrU family lipid kinase
MSMEAKLIFNAASGNPAESAMQLMELLRHLQAQRLQAEVSLVQPEMDLSALARRAVLAGARLIIVSGGDGTIESVARGLVGSRTTLGIIPTGTRNNIAHSLGIPTDSIADAVALLQTGRRRKIDVGRVTHGRVSRFFLEAGAIGLASALYPSADNIQHGDVSKIGEFIATLVSHAPSEIRLRLDRSRHEILTQAHLVLIANMPFMGANFQIAPDVAFDDHRLDVFVYANLSKLDLIGHAMQPPDSTRDARIQRYRARTVAIATDPAMPVIADGVTLDVGNDRVTMMVQPGGLRVMAGPSEARTTRSN